MGYWVSPPAWSHVRWFVQNDSKTVEFEWSWIYALVLFGGFLYCMVNRSLQSLESIAVRKVSDKIPYLWSDIGRRKVWHLTSALIGLTFIFNYFSDVLLAPNLEFSPAQSFVNKFQLAIGIALTLGISLRSSGYLILSLMLLIAASYPLSIWIDYSFEFLGLALAFIWYKKPDLGLFALRCGLGLQLMTLAIHNKWLNPHLGLEFLQHYHWNFMSYLGWHSFSDLTFVFSAGMAEFCFGLVILLGWSTRLVTITALSFFVLTASILGIHELIGHLPILGAGILLIVFGGGGCNLSYIRRPLQLESQVVTRYAN
ncbi:hypothetical protein ACJJIF_09730 [Microbulbifer sp. SSSA002]|uniref:hypothetical protein n=1 Tax=Microbulbifer sp. SSSA002 TaxID=3243376 RepID=UPI00403A31AE